MLLTDGLSIDNMFCINIGDIFNTEDSPFVTLKPINSHSAGLISEKDKQSMPTCDICILSLPSAVGDPRGGLKNGPFETLDLNYFPVCSSF